MLDYSLARPVLAPMVSAQADFDGPWKPHLGLRIALCSEEAPNEFRRPAAQPRPRVSHGSKPNLSPRPGPMFAPPAPRHPQHRTQAIVPATASAPVVFQAAYQPQSHPGGHVSPQPQPRPAPWARSWQEHLDGPAGKATSTLEARLAWLEQRRQQKLGEAQRPEAWLSASFVALVHCPPAGRPRAQWVRVAGPGAKRPAA